MTLKNRIYFTLASTIRKLHIYNSFTFPDDQRETAPFKLVFFCGKSGMEYLNASLFSVYSTWEYLPEVIIVSDGTPSSILEEKAIRWPRAFTIIPWQDCAAYYQKKGNGYISTFANNELWGKKFAAVLYCADHFPTLYSDSDVLWFTSPQLPDITLKPVLKMSQDIGFYYSTQILKSVGEEKCLENVPFNAGVMYMHGDYSTYPKWMHLCEYLSVNNGLGGFSEQTAVAILANYFNKNTYWPQEEVLIKVDDKYDLGFSKKQHKNLVARHYVSNKEISFWKDFAHMCYQRYTAPKPAVNNTKRGFASQSSK